MRSALGVYVHFPFCLARCPYCDFASTAVSCPPHESYGTAVAAELTHRIREEDWSGREVVSIYLGGGTPSLWEPREIARLLDTVASALPVESTAEVTIEANPGQAESASLHEIRAAGVNRVSFGTQSFQRRYLEALGRRHDEPDSLSAVPRARRAGFERVSVDLIHCVPGQDAAGAAEDARRAVASGADHVSAYCLTLEPGVPMEREVRAGRLRLPGEDEAILIEDAVIETLEEAELRRYEVSSFARPGCESVHSTSYWEGREYLALGAAAHGFRLHGKDGRRGGLRYRNIRDPGRYIDLLSKGGEPTEKSEMLEPEELLRDRLFLGMRLCRGVDLSELRRWSGLDPEKSHGEALGRLVRDGLLLCEGARVRPTERGMRFNDTIAERLG